MSNTKERLVYLDMLRIIAAFLVIFNHLPGYTLYMVSSGYKQAVYLFLTMITRMNTPLFMMISGALLLGKEENYSTIFKKRIFRYLIIIVAANSMIWMLYKSFDFEGLFYGILKGSIQGSYWYLYSYMGMLICLPFLRKIAKDLNKTDFWYMLVVHFIVVSIIPCINFLLAFSDRSIQLSGNFNIPLMIESSIFYPIMGYIISKVEIDKISTKILISGAFITILGIITESVFTVYEGNTQEYTQHYVMLFDYMIAIFIFALIRVLFAKVNNVGRLSKLLNVFGSVTFGVYLFDPVLKKFLYLIVEKFCEPYLPTLLVSVIWCLVSFSICGLITHLLKKIRPFKYYI